MLETRIVAGLNEDEIALTLQGACLVRLLPSAECARETWIGGEMSYHDPRTSAGR